MEKADNEKVAEILHLVKEIQDDMKEIGKKSKVSMTGISLNLLCIEDLCSELLYDGVEL